jgi:ATP-dependent protease HslVU (ClpYQ) ATPase subunit
MEDGMDDDKELKIEILDQVKDEMAKDAELAEVIADFMAMLHQANDAVKRGQYETMEDAMEAITGNRPVQINPDEWEADDEG